ncbi:hypothetical protein AXG93_1593s1340 [Marchantia polymorpha subsp. ruderalis]|uniref:Retrotransposon gag domain-containing protein n=1 Tax=Marchantia polymorpha subsp. ruderalis TaxID=1480154 RepID=A0A176WNX1_MARPO|nr:hypothetical protein AXG93_1593s1340 [Marchantia polymorpha subsp. ruderalis]
MLLPDFLEDSALKWYKEYKREHSEDDTWETLTENLIENFLPSESYEKLMCEVTFLKQGENEKVRTYVERTEKLESRFHVVLRKGGDEVDATMVGIRAMLMKNFVGGLRPEIRSKVRYEKPSSKAEAIRIAIRMEESLEDDDSSLVAREISRSM